MKQTYFNTIRFKEVAPTFEIFSTNINKNNYFSDFVTFNDIDLKIFYGVLLSNYHNSYIRQTTGDDFFLDLTNRLLEKYDKYLKYFRIVKSELLSDKNDLLLNASVKSVSDGNGSQTSESFNKSADTPTSVKTSKDVNFIDEYSNLQNKAQGSGTNTVHNETISESNGNIIESVNKVLTMTSYNLKELAEDFADLFTQIEE